jgi:hypothetical protein
MHTHGGFTISLTSRMCSRSSKVVAKSVLSCIRLCEECAASMGCKHLSHFPEKLQAIAPSLRLKPPTSEPSKKAYSIRLKRWMTSTSVSPVQRYLNMMVHNLYTAQPCSQPYAFSEIPAERVLRVSATIFQRNYWRLLVEIRCFAWAVTRIPFRP